jgi:type I restriction enzyme M protein
LPAGQKSYSKTKTIQFNEFAPLIEWWNKREENEFAWKINVQDLKKGFDLDVKNPNREKDEKVLSSTEVLNRLNTSIDATKMLLAQIQKGIG